MLPMAFDREMGQNINISIDVYDYSFLFLFYTAYVYHIEPFDWYRISFSFEEVRIFSIEGTYSNQLRKWKAKLLQFVELVGKSFPMDMLLNPNRISLEQPIQFVTVYRLAYSGYYMNPDGIYFWLRSFFFSKWMKNLPKSSSKVSHSMWKADKCCC